MRKFARPSVLGCALVTLFGLVASAAAQDDGDKEKFQFHGFLTQAYATSSFTDGGPTDDEIILGIPEDGTSSYRFLALQFRYEISDEDLVVVQLSSRALGDSPISEIEDDIELDWAFYERQLGDNTALKVGRIQIPLGIFNEIRDVGTILPFYRPPYTFYREGSFTSETVDGVLFHHTFNNAASWPIDFDVYYGEFELLEQGVLADEPPAIAKAEDALGIQLWLNSPWLDGVRFGLGAQQRDVTEGQEGVFRPIGEATEFDDWYISLEVPAPRFVFRAEYREIDALLDSPALGFAFNTKNTIAYYQVGFFVTEKFRIYLQLEDSNVESAGDIFTRTEEVDSRDDLGISLHYSFSPQVVLKYEYHEVDQELNGFAPVFDPDRGPLLDPIAIPRENGDYSILSLAVSF